MSTNTNTYKKSNVYWLVVTALLMSITIILKTIFYFIPIINGYGLELYLVGYVYGLILIKSWKWKWTFWFITPWLLLVIPPTIVNFWDLLLEYILALYIFLPFVFFDYIVKLVTDPKRPRLSWVLEIICFSVLMTILVFLKLFIHTVAGVLWWMEGDNQWWGSFIFNLPIYGVTLAVALPVAIIVYKPLQKIKI